MTRDVMKEARQATSTDDSARPNLQRIVGLNGLERSHPMTEHCLNGRVEIAAPLPFLEEVGLDSDPTDPSELLVRGGIARRLELWAQEGKEGGLLFRSDARRKQACAQNTGRRRNQFGGLHFHPRRIRRTPGSGQRSRLRSDVKVWTGAGGGGRTHTLQATRDFESRASASCATPASKRQGRGV